MENSAKFLNPNSVSNRTVNELLEATGWEYRRELGADGQTGLFSHEDGAVLISKPRAYVLVSEGKAHFFDSYSALMEKFPEAVSAH